MHVISLGREREGDQMINKLKRGTRNVNDFFYEGERKRIDLLNREFFADVELTQEENKTLIWLCGYDWNTIENIVSAFKKVRG